MYLTGYVSGLRNSAVEAIDVDGPTSCHVSDDIATDSSDVGLNIEGDVLRVNVQLRKSFIMNETFQFSIRSIGSIGVAVFILEQHQQTVGVFKTEQKSKS